MSSSGLPKSLFIRLNRPAIITQIELKPIQKMFLTFVNGKFTVEEFEMANGRISMRNYDYDYEVLC